MTQLAVALARYLDAHRGAPFDWAHNNCCHFAAGWVAQQEGRDPMAGLSATPGRAAARALVRRFGSLADAWSAQLGRAPIAPDDAQVGDLVLMPADGRAPAGGAACAPRRVAMGICNGRVALFMDDRGAYVVAPMTVALHAWRLMPLEQTHQISTQISIDSAVDVALVQRVVAAAVQQAPA